MIEPPAEGEWADVVAVAARLLPKRGIARLTLGRNRGGARNRRGRRVLLVPGRRPDPGRALPRSATTGSSTRLASAGERRLADGAPAAFHRTECRRSRGDGAGSSYGDSPSGMRPRAGAAGAGRRLPAHHRRNHQGGSEDRRVRRGFSRQGRARPRCADLGILDHRDAPRSGGDA